MSSVKSFVWFFKMCHSQYIFLQIECDGCTKKTHIAQSTFGDWTLFQIDLPNYDVINVTYDVVGGPNADSFADTFVTMDDLSVMPGACQAYSE